MVGQAESLAGLPGLGLSREVIAVLPGPQPALRAWPARGSCKGTQTTVSRGWTVNSTHVKKSELGHCLD